MNRTILHRVLCSATFAAAIAVGTSSAHAQAFEGEGITGILSGFGLSTSDDDEKAAIDFGERAPLVVPPSRELPPPGGTTGSIGAAPPNFPLDPDRPNLSAAQTKALWDAQMKSGRPLTPEEMKADTLPAGSKRGYQKPEPLNNERNTLLSPTEMRKVHTVREEERWDKGEPARTRLSDPPAGYRAPASTAPYADKGETKSSGGGFWSRINPF